MEKMRYVSMHHPIFSEEGIFEGKNQAKFSFVVQLLAGYIYVYVAVMAMSGAVSVGDAYVLGAIITMMTGVQKILMQYNQINYRNEYLKTYEDFIKRPNMHYDGTLQSRSGMITSMNYPSAMCHSAIRAQQMIF